jgi:hypothetical protein
MAGVAADEDLAADVHRCCCRLSQFADVRQLGCRQRLVRNLAAVVLHRVGWTLAILAVKADHHIKLGPDDHRHAFAGWALADMAAHEQARDDLVPCGNRVGLASVLDRHRRHSAHGLPASGQEI